MAKRQFEGKKTRINLAGEKKEVCKIPRKKGITKACFSAILESSSRRARELPPRKNKIAGGVQVRRRYHKPDAAPKLVILNTIQSIRK